MNTDIKIHVAGENSLIVYFGDRASPHVSQTIHYMNACLSHSKGQWLIDLIPSYASLLVIFDPLVTDHLWVRKKIHQVYQGFLDNQGVLDPQVQSDQIRAKTITLPVYYGQEVAPDLADLAQHAGLSPEAFIELHQAVDYHVYAIGFAPGFAYLGEVDARLKSARLTTPRKKVPKGAVAIADRQTAVYPADSPGGWNLIGLCPVEMFNKSNVQTMPIAVGDSVRFSAICRDELLALGGEELLLNASENLK